MYCVGGILNRRYICACVEVCRDIEDIGTRGATNNNKNN